MAYLLLLDMVIKGGYKIYNNYRLEKDGICTEAVIREIYQKNAQEGQNLQVSCWE